MSLTPFLRLLSLVFVASFCLSLGTLYFDTRCVTWRKKNTTSALLNFSFTNLIASCPGRIDVPKWQPSFLSVAADGLVAVVQVKKSMRNVLMRMLDSIITKSLLITIKNRNFEPRAHPWALALYSAWIVVSPCMAYAKEPFGYTWSK